MNRNHTRRLFLAKCSVVSAAAFAPASAWALPSRQTLTALERISFEQFAHCVGGRFRVVVPNAPDVRLELVKAELRVPVAADFRFGAPPDVDNEKFSLIFRGPSATSLAQDSYVVAHARLGRCFLFLAPVVARDSSRRYYEAVFNRPRVSVVAKR